MTRQRHVVYDEELQVEAYRLQGLSRPFPNHFHEYYVIGLMERGSRRLTCMGREYLVGAGDLLLFNPGDSHGCTQDGGVHPSIVEFPIPVLCGDPDLIRTVRKQAGDCADVFAVDFSRLAQGCRSYKEFRENMTETPEKELTYLGLALCGGKKQISRLTGNLPLLR